MKETIKLILKITCVICSVVSMTLSAMVFLVYCFGGTLTAPANVVIPLSLFGLIGVISFVIIVFVGIDYDDV